MPVYVCISFVTYEHPLYRFIVLHRGRFVYCPFLLVRFTGSRVFSLSSDLSAGRNRDLLRQSCVRRCHCRRIVPAHQHAHPVVRRQQKDGLDTGCSTACAASGMASGCINVVLIAEAAVGQFLHSGGCAQQFFRNKGVKVVPRIAYAVAGHKLDKQFVAAVSVDCNGIRSA